MTIADDNGSDEINLKLINPDYTMLQFKIKRRTRLRKLMDAYCERVEIAREHVTFKCGGVTILPTDTPLSCDLFEGDIIDVCFTLD